MKIIPVRTIEGSPFSTLTILKEAAGAAPSGMNVTQMRSRIRILDAIDKATDTIAIEDADHTTLTEAINGMPWVRADRNILQIIDDVLTAVAAPTPTSD
jgi:hypothetical protein